MSWRMCVFFFFKQKTAYEMRISDWSSDVCSSDLPRNEVWMTRLNVIGRWRRREWRRCGSVDLQHREKRFLRNLHGSHLLHAPLPLLLLLEELEIGRASCRERVCQYV